MIRNGAVYFAAVGGAGALLARAIVKSEVIAYEDLGTEAIRRLEIKDFPVIVVMDSQGNDLYKTALRQYRREYMKKGKKCLESSLMVFRLLIKGLYYFCAYLVVQRT